MQLAILSFPSCQHHVYIQTPSVVNLDANSVGTVVTGSYVLPAIGSVLHPPQL